MTPFTCPRCGFVSHNPNDAANRYCVRCHVFIDDLRTRASFTWELVDDMLLIIDQNLGGRSVTNDIEQVLARVAAFGIDLDKRRIVYCDSEGRWDGIDTREGGFVRFLLIDASSPQEAARLWPAPRLD